MINKHLGQKTDYPQQYDPSVLVSEPRIGNREKYNLRGSEFVGFDIWNCYEVSFLRESGAPVTCVAKIVYPSSSKVIVESKSLKLYLNSFNMTYFKGEEHQCLLDVERVIRRDLETLIGTRIRVSLFQTIAEPKPTYSTFPVIPLEQSIDLSKIFITDFKENPDLLMGEEMDTNNSVHKFYTTLLRSNCKVTHQPDWGDLYVHIRSKWVIEPVGFLKYIISFRNENHFHEEVVEMIFKRLLDRFNPAELMVGAVYTRRGGIDISPIRSTHPELMDNNLIQSHILNVKKLRQ